MGLFFRTPEEAKYIQERKEFIEVTRSSVLLEHVKYLMKTNPKELRKFKYRKAYMIAKIQELRRKSK